MPTRLPPGPKNAESIRRLLDLAIDIAGNQTRLADVIGVDRATVANYVAGRRQVEWYVVMGALERLLRTHPEHAPRVVAALASELLDQDGVWCSELDPDELGDVSEEGQDVSIAHGATIQAVRAKDPKAVDHADQLVREALELRSAVARGQA